MLGHEIEKKGNIIPGDVLQTDLLSILKNNTVSTVRIPFQLLGKS